MAFLDKIKSAEVNEEAPKKKVNPLLKKKLEPKKIPSPIPTKKVIPTEKEVYKAELGVTYTEEAIQDFENEAPVAAVEEIAAPETPVAEAEMDAPAPSEEKIEEVVVAAEPEKEAEAAAEKIVEAAKEEEKAEEAEVEEAKPEVTEEPKATKSKRKSAPKKTAAPKEEEFVEGSVEMPTTAMGYANAISSISSPFVDEEWESFKTEIVSELAEINISPDMNPGTLKIVIAELSILREKIWHPYQESKSLYERLSSKEPEGLIERVKRINLGAGGNDMERKRAGVLACMQYETAEGSVNLFEMMDESKDRYNFLKSAIDSIKYKTDILITLNGALKLEKDHIQ